MNFTQQELNEIYFALLEQGGFSASLIIKRIESEYTRCYFCDHLILNSAFQEHELIHITD